MAEEEGFEPPVPFGTTVFKTVAFDHSAISPKTLSFVVVYTRIFKDKNQPHNHRENIK